MFVSSSTREHWNCSRSTDRGPRCPLTPLLSLSLFARFDGACSARALPGRIASCTIAKSMYSRTLRSSAIRRDHPSLVEVVTSLHRRWHILLFRFASLPFKATAASAPDNAIIAPLCSLGCDGLMHRGKQIGLLQHIFLVTPVERRCVSVPYEAKIERRDINVY